MARVWKHYVIFRADGQQNFLHLSQSGSITILPVFDCGCRLPAEHLNPDLLTVFLPDQYLMPPLTRSHSAEWEIFHFLAAGPAKRRDLFRCYYMKERHPKTSLFASLTRVISFQRWWKTSEPRGLRFRPHNHRSFSQFMPADKTLYTVNYVGEKNALIWIKARRKKTECFLCVTRDPAE